MALTIEQKEKVIELRENGLGYLKIANELNVSRDQVRDFLKTKAAKSMGLKEPIKIVKECIGCKGSFYVYINSSSNNYCSAQCRRGAVQKKKLVKKVRTCKGCDKEFNPTTKEQFCSVKCRIDRMQERKKLKPKAKNICATCNYHFESENKRKYCSSKCISVAKLKANKQSIVYRNCKTCSKEFETTTRKNAKYCDRECMDIDRRKPHEQFVKELFGRYKGLIVPLETYKGNDNEMTCMCLKCGQKLIKTGYNHLNRGCSCDSKVGRNSLGSKKVEEFLINKGYVFDKEYTFVDLVSDKNKMLHFDFAIKDNDKIKFLIEYDGRQHFEPVWGGEKELERTQMLDALKDEYAKKNNIPLIRINYKVKDINSLLEKKINNI